MRLGGVIVSVIGHAGAVMLTLLSWNLNPPDAPPAGAVVPVEVVTVAPESNVRALAPPQPEIEEDIPAVADAPEIEQPPPAEAAPNARQRPRERNELDFAALQRELLVDKQRTPTQRRQEGAPADRARQGAGLGTQEVAALTDRLRALSRAHIARNQCWREPVDLPEPERLVITVQFSLNRHGGLEGQPRVVAPVNYGFDPAMRTAAESALRAVRQCDPFPFADDPVVGDHYDQWRTMEYVFRPRL